MIIYIITVRDLLYYYHKRLLKPDLTDPKILKRVFQSVFNVLERLEGE